MAKISPTVSASAVEDAPLPTNALVQETPSSVPFPSGDLDGGVQKSSDQEFKGAETQASPDSQTTASSDLTSSDKLTDLPAPSSTPGRNRVPLPSRGFRRSMDASSPAPSFPSDRDMSPSPPSVWPARAPASDSAIDSLTPKQRVSFDSDRASLASARQAFVRKTHGSDPPFPSPVLRAAVMSPVPSAVVSRTPSHSRATSPLRLLQQWSTGHLHRAHTREEPFVPINPFLPKSYRLQFSCNDPELDSEHDHVTSCCLLCDCVCIAQGTLAHIIYFLTDTFPRQAYLLLLFRLPALYFSRVARIFQDAEVSRPDIQRMIDACATSEPAASVPAQPQGRSASVRSMATGLGPSAHPMPTPLPFPEEWAPPHVSPALARFKASWEAFVDSLMREWKTLNVVSALLLSAILTMFQIPSAASDPVTRNAALLSLICALMSLSYGCMYIVRFGTMRSMYRASRWAEDAREMNTLIWWNVWVLLAMPAVWLAWAMLFFVTAVLAFVWRTGADDDPSERAPLPVHTALALRVAITVVFALGMVYFVLIVRTLAMYGARRQRRATPQDAEAVGMMERRGRPTRRQDAAEAEGATQAVVGLGLAGIGDAESDKGSRAAGGWVEEVKEGG